MASGNKTALGKFKASLVITTVAAASVFSTTSASSAQTVIIGGGNDRPVIVNYPPAPVSPYGQSVFPSHTRGTGQISGGSDFSKGARIVSGDEVIVLTPPSQQKKKIKRPKKIAKKPVPKKVLAAKPVAPAPKAVEKPKAPAKKVTVEQKKAPAPKIETVKKAETPAPVPKVMKSKPAAKTVAAAKPAAPAPKPVAAPKPAATEKPAMAKKQEMAKAVEAPKVEVPAKTPSVSNAPKKLAPTPKVDETQVASLGKQSEVSAKTNKIPEIKPEIDKATHQLIFEEGKTELPGDANTLLNDLATTVGSTQDRIQLVAYAKASSIGRARRISLGRALAIREKLMNMGIPNNRIEVRALGAPDGDTPPDRVDLKIISR